MVPAFFSLALTARAEDMPDARQGSDADLAQELSNPIADLITIPVQMNYDRGIGPQDDGWKLQTNIQPVIPFQLNDSWNLITRTIVPVIYQDDILPGSGSDFGLGDINMSLFFSPKKPTSGGILWGIGPVLLFPSATESLLGGKKWGAGPALCTDNARAMDYRRAYQPHMVVCRRQRPAGYQQHLHATLRGVHLAERLDRINTV